MDSQACCLAADWKMEGWEDGKIQPARRLRMEPNPKRNEQPRHSRFLRIWPSGMCRAWSWGWLTRKIVRYSESAGFLRKMTRIKGKCFQPCFFHFSPWTL